MRELGFGDVLQRLLRLLWSRSREHYAGILVFIFLVLLVVPILILVDMHVGRVNLVIVLDTRVTLLVILLALPERLLFLFLIITTP